MSFSYEQQRKEIEEILKEIYKDYQYFYDESLYYKTMGHGLERYTLSGRSSLAFYLLTKIMDLIRQGDLEYALYIYSTDIRFPSEVCVSIGCYVDILDLFLYVKTLHGISFSKLVEYITYSYSKGYKGFYRDFSEKYGWVDPLTQILRYGSLLHNGTQHVYVCPSLILVEPFSPDISSPFHGKHGVIAYCTTLTNLMLLEDSGKLRTFYEQLQTLMDSVFKNKEKELKELLERDPLKACDINTFKNIIRDEIEEANRLMRQYNIIRVALPLD